MRYEGAIYRPPSEANSLIIQTTIGCSHNQCTFCVVFMDKKYRERELAEIEKDINEMARSLGTVRRVFLADGNAMAMQTDNLISVLQKLHNAFPHLERVGIYATPQDLLEKSESELTAIKEAGLGIVYLGVETGNEALLAWIRKGATRDEIIKAGKRARAAGLVLSITVINGLGGTDKMEAHAKDTATLLNQIDPEYLGLLTLMVCDGTPIARKVERGEFTVPGQLDILKEIEMMLRSLELSNCVFRCNHASNYLPLKGNLPADQQKLLKILETVRLSGDLSHLRPEHLRAL